MNKIYLDELKNNGITIIKNFIPNDLCDKIISDYYSFINKSDPSKIIYTDNNKHSRLYNLHIESLNVMNLLLSDKLMDLLDTYFNKKTALNSCIYFEEGSQQCIHRDTPYFWSNPNEGEFVGVWFALEDSNINNGKLEYYTHGHKIKLDPIEFSNNYISEPTYKLFEIYGKDIENLCKINNLSKESPDISKGDIIIWHADLPHGGSIINDNSLTRHSLVAHYLPENSFIQRIDNFFGRSPYEKIMDYVKTINNRKMRNNKYASFAKNDKCI